MPEKNFLKEVIYPLLMRFVAAVMVTIALSLGLALVVHALEEEPVNNNQAIGTQAAEPAIKVEAPKTEQNQPVQVVHYQE